MMLHGVKNVENRFLESTALYKDAVQEYRVVNTLASILLSSMAFSVAGISAALVDFTGQETPVEPGQHVEKSSIGNTVQN